MPSSTLRFGHCLDKTCSQEKCSELCNSLKWWGEHCFTLCHLCHSIVLWCLLVLGGNCCSCTHAQSRTCRLESLVVHPWRWLVKSDIRDIATRWSNYGLKDVLCFHSFHFSFLHKDFMDDGVCLRGSLTHFSWTIVSKMNIVRKI